MQRAPLFSKNTDQHHVLQDMARLIRARHYSIRTEQSYLDWAARFLRFVATKPLSEISGENIEAFLSYLAVERKATASTQNVALNALVFLMTQVLRRPKEDFNFRYAKRSRHLPMVLSPSEVSRLLTAMSGVYALMAGLMYGLRYAPDGVCASACPGCEFRLSPTAAARCQGQ